ncbi:MAG TPA: 2,3-bisphosphoglycerate-independent phosphoglycerate mutase [Chloroflexi bacterium]|nr:2,3-bisphosphoglycerate-independent phosphoglycerate mutase [Chloroflexota bacterium]
MANFDLMRQLATESGGKIILLVMDGLGGLPLEVDGPTELEAAVTPNLDRLAREGSTGLSIPIARGIEPGSGPGHLALFGYDPLTYEIGRGALEAAGIGLEVRVGDVAARGNFCTVDENGVIVDRRAGRIPTEKGAEACATLQEIELPGVEMIVREVKEHRFVLLLRGEGLSPALMDTDPGKTGVAPFPARPVPEAADDPAAQHTAELVNEFLAQAREKLRGHHPANMVTLRGFATDPALPQFKDVYKLTAACVAVYPMYKGVSRLIGMDIIETTAHDEPLDEFNRVAATWDSHDFVFVHIKYTDSRGEDGKFDAKVAVIEQVDAALPALLDLNPDVLIVTGDHSTPAKLRSHSFHPVPTLIWAPATHMRDNVTGFGERQCMGGALGQFPATDLMPLALAHARRLKRFGA